MSINTIVIYMILVNSMMTTCCLSLDRTNLETFQIIIYVFC